MRTANRVSVVKRAFWPSASRVSAQWAYASNSSRMARRSAASSGDRVVCDAMTDPAFSTDVGIDDEANEPIRILAPDTVRAPLSRGPVDKSMVTTRTGYLVGCGRVDLDGAVAFADGEVRE